jgi:hypothetical protein
MSLAFAAPMRPRRRAPYPAHPHEHFVEELWVSRRLFEARPYFDVVVDPFAGFGHVVKSARACGLSAYGSDLVARAAGIAGGRDFFDSGWRAPRRAGGEFAIVANPPFGGRKPLIRDIARLALERADPVALLLPVTRLGPAGAWLEDLPLAEVLLLDRRSSLWPGDIHAARVAAGQKLGAGYEPLCWALFRRGARGAPRVAWLRREG